jgi:starch synthase
MSAIDDTPSHRAVSQHGRSQEHGSFMRILHSSMEAFPYVKVGGLSDVLGALPPALRRAGVDARLLLPGFEGVLEGVSRLSEVRRFEHGLPGTSSARLLAGVTDRDVPLYVLDVPDLYLRSRDPYADFGDSHVKAAALSRAAADIARGGDGRGWRPELLHSHDWQTALAPAYLHFTGSRIPSVMTIHNLGYQGIYPSSLLPSLWLPWAALRPDEVEFWGNVNLLKAGLVYASLLSTVSPTYALEIQRPENAHALEGILRARSHQLRGILNGIDTAVWDPAKTLHIESQYDLERFSRRAPNKLALLREMKLEPEANRPLFGVVSRLNTMKGLDLLVQNVDHLVGKGASLVVVGKGDPALEHGFNQAAARHPGRVAVHVAYDEGMAHRVMAGADFVVVPSRSEPCGLVQMYAMRYGAVPVVRYTGGLADTVSDISSGARATGITFDAADGFSLGNAISRAVDLYEKAPDRFRDLQKEGMRKDFGWDASARAYVAMYEELLPATARTGDSPARTQ